MNFDEPNWLDVWIEHNFSGYGRAIREKYDPPLPSEPYMSMADAKALTRRAVAEAQRAFYWHWINALEGGGYSDAARQMRRKAAEEGIKNSGRPEPEEGLF